jgi:hypothetical protein
MGQTRSETWVSESFAVPDGTASVSTPQRPVFPSRVPRPRSGGTDGPVLAVGHRATIRSAGPGTKGATLTDENGTAAIMTLDEGTVVDIVAWKPRGAGGTRYRIRCAEGDDREGWVGSANLAAIPVPPPRPRVLPPATTTPKAVTARPRRSTR